jgi:peptidoglycan/xylan/chitin deacetylase (PgdA/CDA1 family)
MALDAASVAASGSGRRRRVRWLLASIVALVLVGVTAGVTWGQPALASNFGASGNLRAITLSAGQLSYLLWLPSGSSAVREDIGREAAFTVPRLPPIPPTPRALPPAPVIYFGPADRGAFYITIDDGKTPDPEVLALMQRTHVPITAFLTSDWTAPNLYYWRSFVAAGGDIEDHTVSHPDLTRLSWAADKAQWVGAAQAFRTWFRKSPTLGRPPFGNFNRNVQITAGQAGLRYIVHWSASMFNRKLNTFDHGPLRAGEIVILHWVPGVYDSLVRLLQIAAAQGLHPASLAASLA